MRDRWRRRRRSTWLSNTHDGLGRLLLRSPDNLTRTAIALKSVNARLRNASPSLPFLLDAETLRKGLNFTFVTDVGDLDLLGEVRGIGDFEMVAEGASSFEILGYEFKVIALEKLILAKRTAGRAKDLLAVAELEAILESKDKLERVTNSDGHPD